MVVRGGGGGIMVVVAIANVKRAWVMLQWYGGYNKGIWMSFQCCSIGDSSMVKVVVKCPLSYGARLEWFWHACLFWTLVCLHA